MIRSAQSLDMENVATPGSLLLSGSQAFKNRCTAALGVGIPAASVVLAVILLRTGAIHFTSTDFAIAFFMYTLTGLGVTVGLHRMFTHRSFDAGPRTQAFLGACGIMAIQGSVTGW